MNNEAKGLEWVTLRPKRDMRLRYIGVYAQIGPMGDIETDPLLASVLVAAGLATLEDPEVEANKTKTTSIEENLEHG